MIPWQQPAAGFGAALHGPPGLGARGPAPTEQVSAVAAQEQQRRVAAGDAVSAADLARAVFAHFGAASWAELGLMAPHQVPLLAALEAAEQTVAAFVHARVCATPGAITTAHDVEQALCRARGLRGFADLGLGPFVRQPAVAAYFRLPAGTRETPAISAGQVYEALVAHLVENNLRRVNEHQFAQIVARALGDAPHISHLGVCVRNFHVFMADVSRQVADARNDRATCYAAIRDNLLREFRAQTVTDLTGSFLSYLRRAAQNTCVDTFTFERLGEVGPGCTQLAEKFLAIKEMPFGVFVSSISKAHQDAHDLAVGSMAAFFIYLTTRLTPSERAYMYRTVPPLILDEEVLLQEWAAKIKTSNWQLADVKLYFNRDIIGKHVFKKLGSNKRHAVFSFVARLVILSVSTIRFLPSELDRSRDFSTEIPEKTASLVCQYFEEKQQHTVAGLYSFLKKDKSANYSSLSLRENSRLLRHVETTYRVQMPILPARDTPGDLAREAVGDALVKALQEHSQQLAATSSVAAFLRLIKDIGDCVRGEGITDVVSAIVHHFDRVEPLLSQIATQRGQELPENIVAFLGDVKSRHSTLTGDEISRFVKDFYRVDYAPDSLHRAFESIEKSRSSSDFLVNPFMTTSDALDGAAILDAADVVELIRRLPLLSNCADSLSWDALHAARLGPLGLFLAGHRHELGDLLFLQVSPAEYVKLDPAATIDSFTREFKALHPRESAAQLCSLVALSGGLSAAPISLLRNIVKLAVQDYSWPAAAVERFLEDLLDAVPSVWRLPIGCKVFAKVVASSFTEMPRTPRILQLLVASGSIDAGKAYKAVDLAAPPADHDDQQDTSVTVATTQQRPVTPPRDEPKRHTPEVPHTHNDTTPHDAREIIAAIRRSEFGLGLDLPQSAQDVVGVQFRRNCRALQRLSRELYSKDSHFVLELIQNADDNAYAPGVTPEVEFCVAGDAVEVRNNEVGFSESNIRALCDVGSSTKAGKDFGYIGQKGIGFKSVFRISDAPEIHSNGFHIAFSSADFIVPRWKDEPSDEGGDWATRIRLPLKPEITRNMPRFLKKFNDVHPNLLLFLHKIQRIVVRQPDSVKVIARRPSDLHPGVVTLLDGSNEQSWLLVKRRVAVPPGIREGVAATEIALAFDLGYMSLDCSSDAYRSWAPAVENVFAFLPLRSWGFRFIVQADFIIPSSRQDVDNDHPWNEFLRSQFAPVFVEAIERHLEVWRTRNVGNKHITNFCKTIPTESSVSGFFKPLAREILRALRSTRMVLTDAGEIKEPTSCVWVDERVRELLPAALITSTTGLHIVHRDLELSSELRESLGIRKFEVSLLSLCFDALASGGAESEESLNRLLLALHHLALSEKTSENVYDKISELCVFPLSSGTRTAIADTRVFFIASGDSVNDCIPAFAELSIIDSRTVDTSDNIIADVLAKLGAKPLTAHEVFTHHVLEYFATKSDADALVAYTAFAMEHVKMCGACSRDESLIYERLSAVLLIVAENGVVVKLAEDSAPVYLGSHYGGVGQVTFKNARYLSKAYLANDHSSRNVKRWSAFFKKLGAVDFLHIEKIVSPVVDYASRDFDDFCESLASLSATTESALVVLSELDRRWTDFRDFCFKPDGSVSSFGASLAQKRWIPSRDGCVGNALFPPHSFFALLGDAIPALLAPYFPTLPVKIQHAEFAEFLAIKPHPDATDVLHVVDKHARQELDQAVNIDDMVLLYQTCGALDAATADFSEKRVVYVPSRRTFLRPKDVFWSNPLNQVCTAAAGLAPGLDSDYAAHGLLGFFTSLGVREHPSVVDMEPVLAKYRHEIAPDPAELAAIVKFFAATVKDKDALRRIFCDHRLLRSNSDASVFALTEDNVYVSDDDQVAAAFQDCGAIKLVCAKDYPPDFLVERLGVRSLSQHVRVQFDYADRAQTDLLADFLRDVSPYLTRFVATKQPSKLAHVPRLLQKACYTVSGLQVRYSLGSHTVSRPRTAILADSLYTTSKSPSTIDFEFILEITKVLSDNGRSADNELASLLHSVWLMLGSDVGETAIESFCTVQGIKSDAASSRKRARQDMGDDGAPGKARRLDHDASLRTLPLIGVELAESTAYANVPDYVPSRDLAPTTVQFMQEVGRAGEQIAYDMIRAERPGCTVSWINESAETGLPYDIVVTDERGAEEFIEVKASSSFTRRCFDLSVSELNHAMEVGSAYTIYKLSGVRAPYANVQFARLENVAELIRAKRLRLLVSF